jgi:ABC-type sugar transport system permease subunit
MKTRAFLGFTAPSNIVMLALLVFPLVFAGWLGFHYITFSNINAPDFIFFQNFIEVLADREFWEALQWTLIIIVVTVPIHLVLGFVMALLLDQVPGQLRAIYLALMLLPMLVIPVVGTVVFRQLFEPSGLGTWIYRQLAGAPFIFNEGTIKTLILTHTVWYITPFALVIFFAGLQTIPPDLADAAAIDGANRIQQIRHIVLPHLRPLIVLTLLISVMDMFRLFDNIFVFTGMNPTYNADTVLTYNFRVAMSLRRLGKGNAVAIITTIAIMVVLLPFLQYMYREYIKEK